MDVTLLPGSLSVAAIVLCLVVGPMRVLNVLLRTRAFQTPTKFHIVHEGYWFVQAY